MIHIDDWLDIPTEDKDEEMAKVFLEHCRRPAVNIDYMWLENNPLFCDYKGNRYRCTGASRMGDVWLAKDLTRVYGYDLRVDVDDCSHWGRYSNRKGLA